MEDSGSIFEESEKTFIELSNSQCLKELQYEFDFASKTSWHNDARGS